MIEIVPLYGEEKDMHTTAGLRPSETSTTIQARILGLQLAQVPVIHRLRELKVPEELMWPATRMGAGDGPESAIIAWYMEQHKLSDVATVRVLNGETTLEHEKSLIDVS